MRSLIATISLLLLLASCATKSTQEMDPDVYAFSYGKTGDLLDADAPAHRIYFSKAFWSYLGASHPQVTARIFLSHRMREADDMGMRDSAWSYFQPGIGNRFLFRQLLADSAGGTEKESFGGPAFFVIPDDTTQVTEEVEQPRFYPLDASVKKEYARFRAILTGTDTADYLFLYRKRIGDSLWNSVQ